MVWWWRKQDGLRGVEDARTVENVASAELCMDRGTFITRRNTITVVTQELTASRKGK